MDRVVKNEWVAESGSGCGMKQVVTRVNKNWVTLYHEPKNSSRGEVFAWIVFMALLYFAVNGFLKLV